jgi:hypothetical protein
MHSMLIRPNITYFLLMEKKTILTLHLILLLKLHFPRKSHIEFWVGTGGGFLHISRKALNRLPALATPYL